MALFSTGIGRYARSLSKSQHNYLNLVPLSNNLVTARNFSSRVQRKMMGIFKLGIAGITIGAIVGTGYSIHQMNNPSLHLINEETVIPMISANELPKITPSRQIQFPKDRHNLKLTLYQYQTCPFCCKVRAFFDYYGISYDVIEVDPVLRQSIKWSPYKKVPILVAETKDGYQPLNDSTMIISALTTYLKGDKSLHEIVSYYPSISFFDEDGSKKHDIMNKYFVMQTSSVVNQSKEITYSEERKWRKWVDDVLVHTLSPNVYRTTEEAFQAFNWFSDVGEWEKHFPSWERYLIIYVGASAMWLIGKRLKKKYSLKDDVRESLYDECNHWVRTIDHKGTKFMGGNQPNLADLAVYGALCSIEGCTAFQDALQHSKIKKWYFDMKEEVGNHKGISML